MDNIMAKVSQGNVMVTKRGINKQSRPLRVFNLVLFSFPVFIAVYNVDSGIITQQSSIRGGSA